MMVSAFATTGMRLTREPSCFMTSMSSGFKLWGYRSIRCFLSLPHSCSNSRNLRVTGWLNEVQAHVHSQVVHTLALCFPFTSHVCMVLLVQELNNRYPAVLVVHVVSEPGRVNDGQTDVETLLLDFYRWKSALCV